LDVNREHGLFLDRCARHIVCRDKSFS
jgi:hypothetical protein